MDRPLSRLLSSSAGVLVAALSFSAGAQPPPDSTPPPSDSAPLPPGERDKPPRSRATAEPAAAPGAEPEAKEDKAVPDHDEPLPPDEDRPEPDYGGRGDEPVTAGEVLIWVPRGILYPVYLLTEYGIRWPVGKIVVAAEEAQIQKVLTEFFTFGPGGKSGVVPSFLIDFGLRPSVGVYFFSDDAIVDNNQIRAHVAFGGVDWYRATLTNRQVLQKLTNYHYPQEVQIKGTFNHRPDYRFYGLGPESVSETPTEAENFSQYGQQTIDATAAFNAGYWRSSYVKTWVRFGDTQYKPELVASDSHASLEQAIAEGRYPSPPLLDDGFLALSTGFEGSIDTRPIRDLYVGEASDHVPPSGTGLKIGLRGQVSTAVREAEYGPGDLDYAIMQHDNAALTFGDLPNRPSWVSYGATLGGYLDLYHQRIIGLSAIVDFADPLDDNGVLPFTELVSLGGQRPLRGFLEDRLLDRSSAVAMVEYRWPIHVFLDGTIHYALGNVFGEHLENFDPELLRQSFGIGFRASGARDHTFELLVAGGTDTIKAGSDLDSFRFVFGSTAGF